MEYEDCAIWLERRLRAIGGAPEPRFRTWLTRRARRETAQNLLVDAEAHRVLRFLAGQGVPAVPLKGTARRLGAALFPYADARATHDVDVLIPLDHAADSWRRLRQIGYELLFPEASPSRTIHHLGPLWSGARVAVELHTSTSRTVRPHEAWRRTTEGAPEVAASGFTTRIPSATELLWHAVSHAMKHGCAAFRLRFFLDAVVLCASGAALDWSQIASRLDAGEIVERERARAWLGAAASLAGTELPPIIGAGVPPYDVGRALRWRLAVLRHFGGATGAGEKLLDEGTRCDIGLGLTPALPGTSRLQRSRRRVAAATARWLYRLWRITHT